MTSYHWNWLVPSTVCLFLGLALFNQREGIPVDRLPGPPSMLLSLSNESAPASLPRSAPHLTNNTFELTNFSGSPSATGAFAPYQLRQ